MDWLLATPQLHSAFSSLGSLEGDIYVVSPNALAILEEINYKLTYEDQTLRTFRRAIGFGQNVRSDLIPLLENAKDGAVLDSVIRILVNLTVPVECLFSVDVMYRTEVGRHTIFELNNLLYTTKEAFTDAKSTKSVVEYMKHILESDTKLSPPKCDQINNCLLLLRNILHIPEMHANYIVPTVEANGGHMPVSMQNTIIWNLFIQSIDKLLLYLMTCPQRAFWGVSMVQLIALIYKDQHVSTLQKLLNLWFEASLSESSEDNESNTSPPKQGSGDSSPMLTSDPTSDASDSGGGCKNEGSDDRRQALREETEATLQEVSRKGHEYQNSMSRVPADKQDSSEAASDITAIDCELPCTSVQSVARAMEAAHFEDNNEDSSRLDANESCAASQEQEENKDNKGETNIALDRLSRAVSSPSPSSLSLPISPSSNLTQPADNATDTSNANLLQTNTAATAASTTNDITATGAGNFKPPPQLPIKPSTSAQAAKAAKLVEMYEDEILTVSAKKLGQKSPHAGQLQLTKGKCCPQKRECPSSQSELSDCGYGTQVENQESISTSSNDDDGPQGKPQHQKPPCNTKPRNKQRAVMSVMDKKELRRKKLVKRSKSSLMNMKGLVQHTPTDEDISNLLKEFTVDFLFKGYGYLVEELHTQLISDAIPIDTSHFFWLLTYFLKFAAQLELDMEYIDTILTYDVISYLTYEGVSLCEQLELNARQEGSDLKPYLRRMHLVVTAIREFLQAIETYNKISHLSEDDRVRLQQLQLQISATEDLRCLFVLLLRRFNPSIQSKQYLQDLVVTNHILLMILDSASKLNSHSTVKMMEHVSQFATLEVMHYYGILLEDFNNNGEFVNDCIFTMMHHVGGDLGQIGVLFQPIILKTFSRIWETEYDLCDDWSDLIEYVIHKFINTPQKSPLTIPTTSLTEMTKEHNLENTVCIWSQEEMDTLYWYYVQSKKNNDIVGKIVKLFKSNGNKLKSRISIIQQLLEQDIITLVEYDNLMKFEDAEYQRTLLTTPSSGTTESGIDMKDSSFVKPLDDIQILRDLIIKEHKGQHLVWLQKLLVECCYIKLSLKQQRTAIDENVMEPVAYHCICKHKSIPIVQWNNEHAATMLYQPFMLLLHKLGFQLPADAGSIFARIPDFWTPEMMYGLAQKLGPLDKLSIKFDTSELTLESSPTSSRCRNHHHHNYHHYHHHHHHHPRASLSSSSSFEVEFQETDELTLIPEVDASLEKAHAAMDIFAVPKTKHANAIIRYTPDPSPTPTIPNWLQLVMRSKCSQLSMQQKNPSIAGGDESHDVDVSMTSSQSKAYASLVATTTTTSSAQSSSPPPMVVTDGTTDVASLTASQTTTTPLSSLTMMHNIIESHDEQQQQQHQQQQPQQNQLQQQSTASKWLAAAAAAAAAITTPTTTTTCAAKIDATTTSALTLTPTPMPTPIPAAATAAEAATATAAEEAATAAAIAAATVAATATATATTLATTTIVIKSTTLDVDTAMKSSFEGSEAAGLLARKMSLEQEYSAMVASVYEHEIANCDNVSVVSDLTRMYVSDEDEKHEFRVPHYH